MPSIASPGPSASWTESRQNYAGAEFGKSAIPSFGRAIDGDMALSTTFAPTIGRNNGAAHASVIVAAAYMTQFSVTSMSGTFAAGQYVACAGVPDGTTVVAYVAGQSMTVSVSSGSAAVTGLTSTSSMALGQFCTITNIGLCYISTITSATSIIVTKADGSGLALATATSATASFVSYGLLTLSAPGTLAWQSSSVSLGASSSPMSSRSVDAPQVSVASIDATNTILSVNSQTASTMGSNYDLQVGDPCVIINAQGASGSSANVGNWELCRIAAISGASGPLNPLNVTLADPLTRIYGNTANTNLANQKVVLAKVAEYGNVAINSGGVLTATSWNGTGGGILAVAAQQVTCSGTGKISVDGIGYRGQSVAGGVGEGNQGTTSSGTGGAGGLNATPGAPMVGGTGGFAPPVPATPGGAQSGGGGGGGGGNGGGGGGGGGYNPALPGGVGGAISRGGGGAAGGYFTPTGNGTAGGVGGSSSPFGVAPTPASTTVPYGASGSGGSPAATPGNAQAGGSTGVPAVPQLFMGGAGGSSGSGGAGAAGGAAQTAPPTAGPSAPVYVGSAGGAGGTGAGWTSGNKGGNGGGIIMLFARTVTSLNASSLGAIGSAGGQSGGLGVAGSLPSNVPGTGSYDGCGGAGGGGAGAGGCGSGASGTIYVFAQTVTTLNTLNVSPVAGAAGAPGGAGGPSVYPNASVNYAGAGLTGASGGAGAGGRVKLVYAVMDGVAAASSADGAGLITTNPASPTPVGYKQTL